MKINVIYGCARYITLLVIYYNQILLVIKKYLYKYYLNASRATLKSTEIFKNS